MSLLQPVLRGPLLYMSPSRAEDFEALLAVASDPLIWEQHPARDRWRREVFRVFFDGGLTSAGALTVRETSSDDVIGSSRYYAYSASTREIAIGYTFLARRCWGGAFNREMKRLMLAHAFQFVDRVWFHIAVENRRSRRAIEAVGASLDREVMNDPDWKGASTAYYVIDRSAAPDGVSASGPVSNSPP